MVRSSVPHLVLCISMQPNNTSSVATFGSCFTGLLYHSYCRWSRSPKTEALGQLEHFLQAECQINSVKENNNNDSSNNNSNICTNSDFDDDMIRYQVYLLLSYVSNWPSLFIRYTMFILHNQRRKMYLKIATFRWQFLGTFCFFGCVI